MYQNDVSLIRSTIQKLHDNLGIEYDEALNLFYTSKVAKKVQDENTGYFTYAAGDLADKIMAEIATTF